MDNLGRQEHMYLYIFSYILWGATAKLPLPLLTQALYSHACKLDFDVLFLKKRGRDQDLLNA